MNDSSARHIIQLGMIAAVILLLMSALPWSSMTGNRIKDFSFFSDLFPSHVEQDVSAAAAVDIDPELLALQSEQESAPIIEEEEEYVPPVNVEPAPRVDGHVVIENYGSSAPMANLKNVLASGTRTARIGFIGDSFIEGDIMTQDLRALLQEAYGGQGVGFMAMHSEFPGFRRSVRQQSSGWTNIEVRNQRSSDHTRTLAGIYSTGSAGASTVFRGTTQSGTTGSWESSGIFLSAADSVTAASVTLSIDGSSRSFTLEPGAGMQYLSLDGTTSSFSVKVDSGSVKALGAYLDGKSGIAVDCMSMRGNSGLTLRSLNQNLAAVTSASVPYDLIVLEFGINALTAEQSDYTAYAAGMKNAVRTVRAAYPEADILIMGISDRGNKSGSQVHSMRTCVNMIEAQRNYARAEGCMFWDTRQAQGGEDAVVEWRERHLVNGDYIHLNHEGGKVLARELFFAINHALSR